MRKLLLYIFLSAACLSAALPARAQRFSVGTNVADWLSLGTMNASASAAVARHFTLNAEARVNPWTFNTNDSETQLQNRHQTYSIGTRWWPWYVYSGWWVGLAAQYQEYNRGGIFSRNTEEGDAFGAVLSAGYTLIDSVPFFKDARTQLKWKLTLYTRIAMRLVDEGSKRSALYVLE